VLYVWHNANLLKKYKILDGRKWIQVKGKREEEVAEGKEVLFLHLSWGT